MNQPITRRDLAERGMDALPLDRQQSLGISRNAGGVSFASALEVIEFAKLMSTADKAVPKHLRANPGACLRIVFQAVEWQMSPWSVADKSYEVNDRIAYESQLIHAVIEARAPLKERLDAVFDGEGVERRCTIIGKFTDGTERRITTPMIKDIKIKNSPLWTSDVEQQLFYYGSRSWSRRWCPDIIMGLYTKDELQADPSSGRPEEDVAPGLHARLVGSQVNRDEGHQGHEHVHQTLNGDKATEQHAEAKGEPTASAEAPKVKRTRKKKDEPAAEPVTEQPVTETSTEAQPSGGAEPEAESENPEPNQGEASARNEPISGPAPVAEMKPGPAQTITPEEAKVAVEQKPKNADEWRVYALAWIAALTDYEEIRTRWSNERPLRNQCGVTEEYRRPVQDVMTERCKELGE